MSTRREFLATASALAAAPLIHAHVGGSDMLKVGLVGCGGRGTGAAENALKADPHVQLYALADAFADRLHDSLGSLTAGFGKKVDVPESRQFVGLDAYKQLIDSGVDVVLLASPPGFRPAHLRYAVEKGKHIFCEKPMAVDGPGVRSVLESAAMAKQKGLALVSGFCYRYDPPKRETVKRIHEGAIGDVVAVQTNYLTQAIWMKERQPGWGDLEYQIRNWYYFTWLSGDFIVEQHIHSLDKAAWVLGGYPVAAYALGGRQVRTDPKFGHIYDHFAVAFEYPNGKRAFSYCRQQLGCFNDVSDHVIGTKGTAELMRHVIEPAGGKKWKYEGPRPSMYDHEHVELFASIRGGQPINDGEFMAHSTLMGILGRMAAYTGKRVTWQQALQSKEDLSPPVLDFKAEAGLPPVAMPGQTKFS